MVLCQSEATREAQRLEEAEAKALDLEARLAVEVQRREEGEAKAKVNSK